MDDFSFVHQWMNSMDEIPVAGAFAENLQQSVSQPTINRKISMADSDRPAKLIKTNSWGSFITDALSNPQTLSSSSVLSFDNSNYTNQMVFLKPKEEVQVVSSKYYGALPADILKSQGPLQNQRYGTKAHQGEDNNHTSNRSSQSQDHIIAERKRREKLSQRFIALSAIVPGLKKTDKASVLGDTIKYLKQMQEQVKILEEKTRKRTVESVVFVKKSQLFSDDDNSCIDQDFSETSFDQPLPEIEARISDKDILVRIHCEKKKGLTEKILSEIEKLHLSIVNSSVITFGGCSLDITIIAQMDTEFCMTLKDLVKTVRSNIQKFI